MSFTGGLKREPLAKIADRLANYELVITSSAPVFEMSGKKLEELCKQHPQDLSMYALLLQECKTIEQYVAVKAEEQEGLLYRKYIESGARALGASELKQYVKSDPLYVEIKTIMVEVDHVKRSLEAIVGALETMGWTLSNITKLRVAQMDHVIL
jgi:hypothetical protein